MSIAIWPVLIPFIIPFAPKTTSSTAWSLLNDQLGVPDRVRWSIGYARAFPGERFTFFNAAIPDGKFIPGVEKILVEVEARRNRSCLRPNQAANCPLPTSSASDSSGLFGNAANSL
jgi:hypothetical protein